MTGDRGPLQSAAPGDVLAWEHPLGAHRLDDEHVRFRVWAPRPATLALRAAGGDHPLTPAGGGVHETVLALPAAGPEIDYAYVLDGGEPLPDPCSRWQPQGLRGPSRVLDARALGGRDGSDGFTPPAADELIIYELHIGTFTPEGTFAAAAGHLRELAQLGVTAIEIMPVAEFPGARGWGYDGVYISAAQSSYGGPRELAQLVASAHGAGLAVILDVVYNHVGASGAPALEAFGPYFTAQYETPWGKAINYDDADCGAVREWVCQSAEGWIRDFGIDGLRLDALHAIHDAGAEHIVSAVARRVHAINARAFVIAESGMNDPKVVRPPQRGGWSCDAVWADDFHHALHALITGEQDGYYADFGRVSQLAKAFHRPHVDDGGYSAFRRRRFGAPPRTSRPSASSSSPRTTTRSATAPTAIACRTRRGRSRRSARCWRRSRHCCSWARSTASRRPFSSSPITSRRRSRSPPARGAGASSPRSRGSATRSPTPRIRPPSCAPSSRAGATRV